MKLIFSLIRIIAYIIEVSLGSRIINRFSLTVYGIYIYVYSFEIEMAKGCSKSKIYI